MENVEYLIVGGGLAGATAAATIREIDNVGRITILSQETKLPYHRPPLSKGILLGYQPPDKVFVYPPSFYNEKKIDVLLGIAATTLSPEENVLLDIQGNRYSFDKLLVATGCRLRQLNIPGSGLDNIFYLRVLDDSLTLFSAFKEAKQAVIIGSGFIGLEAASALAQNGIKTTMLIREDRLFPKLGSPELSDYFYQLYSKNKVEIIFQQTATAFLGTTKVKKVVTTAGKELPADIVVVGIGVIPNTEFLVNSGVELDNGVVVNEYLETSRADVFAAGDIANYYDLTFKKRRRVEHWDNAKAQGRTAALNMLGQKQAYQHLPYFFSDMFDISWEFVGDNSDVDEVIISNSLTADKAIIYYLKESTVKAAFLLMQTAAEREKVTELIKSQRPLTKTEKESLSS
jgi:NADPH-dependent 2,4-dienoyl-CoA reductase/sulfur reductase-like enzyme